MIVRRFVNEPKRQYVSADVTQKSFVEKSVQSLAVNSIIEGYFPKENVVRQMAIKRVNKMLSIIIGVLIAVVVVSYYFVISCEMQLNDLSRQTVILNNENTDLQNKLDGLKSFNNVDKTFQQNNMLKRAGQVIETPEVIVDSSETQVRKKTKRKVFKYAIGF
jgi:predicted PurR-regulated permease PerM